VLSDVIGNLLPSAFAVALSPIPIVAVVLVLGSVTVAGAVLFYLVDAKRANAERPPSRRVAGAPDRV
jgi:hypothetical protein